MLAVAGATAIDITCSGATVTVVVASFPDGRCVAAIVAVPAASAVTYPVAASTLAIAGAEDAKVESKVTMWLVPSLKDPVTLRACTPPIWRLTGLGVTATVVTKAIAGGEGSDG